MKKFALFALVLVSFSNAFALTEGKTKCHKMNASTTPEVSVVNDAPDAPVTKPKTKGL